MFNGTLILLTIWILFVNLIQKAPVWISLIHIGMSFWWFSTYTFFRVYLEKNSDDYNKIKKFIQIVLFFYFLASLYASYNISVTYDNIATVNLVYYLIILTPFLLLMKDNKFKKISFTLIIVILMLSMKRGALIVFPIMIISYFILEGILKKKILIYVFKTTILLLTFITLIIIANKFTDGYLINRFSLDSLADGSGRSRIFSTVINEISNRNFISLLIGEGSGSSISLLGTGAHNEWLEFMYNFGIIGTLLYGFLCVNLLGRGIKLLLIRSRNSSAYNIMLVYIIVVGMIGGIYFVHSTFYIMFFYGVLDSLEYDNKTANF